MALADRDAEPVRQVAHLDARRRKTLRLPQQPFAADLAALVVGGEQGDLEAGRDRPGRDLDGTSMDDVFTSLPSPLYPHDPVQQVDAVLPVSARLGYDVLPWLELWGAMRNLLDESYESEYAYPGPGCELSAGLTARGSPA